MSLLSSLVMLWSMGAYASFFLGFLVFLFSPKEVRKRLVANGFTWCDALVYLLSGGKWQLAVLSRHFDRILSAQHLDIFPIPCYGTITPLFFSLACLFLCPLPPNVDNSRLVKFGGYLPKECQGSFSSAKVQKWPLSIELVLVFQLLKGSLIGK